MRLWGKQQQELAYKVALDTVKSLQSSQLQYSVTSVQVSVTHRSAETAGLINATSDTLY